MNYPRVAIEYCTQCRWLLRASWLAQELLTTFPIELGELALVPGSGGVFCVRFLQHADSDEEVLFSRAEAERFPEPKEIKQLVRDRVDPDRDLGHSDRKPPE
ncbi:MAG: SelT/SelW/SelH family protein [Polyangiaceae bacterium]